jgi:hypothetical protein
LGVPGALDPSSRSRIRIFSFKLLVLFPLSILLAARYRDPLLETMSSFAGWYGVFPGLVAAFRRERVEGPSLDGWDEMLGFFALKYIAQLLSATVG